MPSSSAGPGGAAAAAALVSGEIDTITIAFLRRAWIRTRPASDA
jgi:hypothetical protein